VSTTDNNDEDDEEVLVPQTPLTTRPSTLLFLLSRSVMVGKGEAAAACAVRFCQSNQQLVPGWLKERYC
jgi:hypothetical protein